MRRTVVANLIDSNSEIGKSEDSWLKEIAFFRWSSGLRRTQENAALQD